MESMRAPPAVKTEQLALDEEELLRQMQMNLAEKDKRTGLLDQNLTQKLVQKLEVTQDLTEK